YSVFVAFRDARNTSRLRFQGLIVYVGLQFVHASVALVREKMYLSRSSGVSGQSTWKKPATLLKPLRPLVPKGNGGGAHLQSRQPGGGWSPLISGCVRLNPASRFWLVRDSPRQVRGAHARRKRDHHPRAIPNAGVVHQPSKFPCALGQLLI